MFCDFLAANYTPGAQKLQIQDLPKKKKIQKPSIWDSEGERNVNY